MNRSVCRVMMGVAGLAVLGMTATLAGCALPSEPKGIPAALDAAISEGTSKQYRC